MGARRRTARGSHLAGRLPLCVGAAVAALLVSACGPSPAPSPAIRLVDAPENPGGAYVEVAGAGGAVLDAARGLDPTSSVWTRLLAVRVVAPDGTMSETAVAGRYATAREAIRFTPLFPFDPGRRYDVRFDPSAVVSGAGAGRVVQATVGRPAALPSAPTSVTHVFPSADVLPENQLRLYVHFSAPMGRRGGLDHIRLLDERGHEVPDPFVPLEEELWNADRTRYTLLFDPGRQKRGIRPNREMGPSLVAGRRYTLVIERAWIDGHGQPLDEAFSRTFRVGPPELAALDETTWRISPPAAGTREALVVVFPRPLDHGLLQTALGLRRDGHPVAGDVRVEADETRWTMTPAEPWRPGRCELIALPILEDRAGNRIGRAFELDPAAARRDASAEAAARTIPFTLR